MLSPDGDRAPVGLVGTRRADRPPLAVLLPVHNGARWLEQVLGAIRAARHDGPLEIIAVADGSTDGPRDILGRHAGAGRLTLLDGTALRRRPAALNLCIRTASHPFIAQIDQDVVIHPECAATLLLAALELHGLTGSQGCLEL